MDLDVSQVSEIVQRALAEDIGAGDITTRLTVPPRVSASATIVAKASGVIAGLPAAEICFRLVDQAVAFRSLVSDGARVRPGDVIAELRGPAASILTAERVALNFLQRMSGIATLTSMYAAAVAGTKARIVDTRKTTPGLRVLEKYAVRIGGGFNHRFGLDDGVLIKDNHIAAAGGVGAAVRAAKAGAPHTLRVEVEVRSLQQLAEALDSGTDAVLLDNMSVSEIEEAVKLVAGRATVEASGGVNETTVSDIAKAGVDLISVGRLTHSFESLDLSLDITVSEQGQSGSSHD